MDFQFPPPGPPLSPSLGEIVAAFLPSLVLITVIGLASWRSKSQVGRWETVGWGLAAAVFGGLLAATDQQSDRYAIWMVTATVSLIAMGFAIWQSSRRRMVPTWMLVAATAGTLVITTAGLPPKLAVREAPRRSVCKGNLKQLGLILHQVINRTGDLPASTTGEPPRSWRVETLSIGGEEALRQKYDDRVPWDHSQNTEVAGEPPSFYVCPTNFNGRDAAGRVFTAYAALIGQHASMSPHEVRSPSRVTDGLAQTVLMMEACGQEIVWTEPRDIDIDSIPIGINLNGATKTTSPGVGSSYHAGGCHVLMADGSVRFVTQNIDQKTPKALLTVDGGEVVDEF